MLWLSGFELYSRWVPLLIDNNTSPDIRVKANKTLAQLYQ